MPYLVQIPENLRLINEPARQEILHFIAAIDSYPARAAKNPRLTFQQHLGCILAAARKNSPNRR